MSLQRSPDGIAKPDYPSDASHSRRLSSPGARRFESWIPDQKRLGNDNLANAVTVWKTAEGPGESPDEISMTLQALQEGDLRL
jgi:hypothetical protein